jgi:hypothetical protein
MWPACTPNFTGHLDIATKLQAKYNFSRPSSRCFHTLKNMTSIKFAYFFEHLLPHKISGTCINGAFALISEVRTTTMLELLMVVN